MRISRKKFRLAALVLGALFLIYCAGYAFCRRNHLIVHITACAGDQYSFHDVDAGDSKLAVLNPVAAALYTPLRYAEKFYWYMARPVGSDCR